MSDQRPPRQEVPINRGFSWIRKALETFRERPLPGEYLPVVVPTIDTFAWERVQDLLYQEIDDVLGSIEVTHGPVPVDRTRFYMSAAYEHDDPIARNLVPGRVVEIAGGFPFAALGAPSTLGQNVPNAVRNQVVPPGGFFAVRSTNGMGAGARMRLRVLFVDLPLGEYVYGATWG